ncbi:hypothetical protein Acr_08g0006960 [Actinidia rufa]|uniref:Uncharacterized protein n=1 Tax=Actinidia rufa TaxID=165716 RepID=A0A7J0F0V7_9ERIC|nr:hypothetical protein Acr_08g0006960 [Actinidia rufa]
MLIHQARAPVPHKPDAENGDGTMPPDLYASVNQLRPNRACRGQPDASDLLHMYTVVRSKRESALVSSYRYEGPKFREDIAKSEAKTLFDAVKNAAKKNPIEDEVVRILSTRSKLHLKSVFKHYKDISGKHMEEEVEAYPSLKHTVECLSTPHTYFIKVLEEAINPNANEKVKEGLTRVIVTRADADMKAIKEEYHKKNGAALIDKIEHMANGNFKNFLLTLLARGG